MGCHSLLQGIFPTQGWNPGLLHCRWILYRLSHQGSPQWGKPLPQSWVDRSTGGEGGDLEEADSGDWTRGPATGTVFYGPSPNLVDTSDSIQLKRQEGTEIDGNLPKATIATELSLIKGWGVGGLSDWGWGHVKVTGGNSCVWISVSTRDLSFIQRDPSRARGTGYQWRFSGGLCGPGSSSLWGKAM